MPSMASTSDDDDFYEAHVGELVEIATKGFKIPLAAAERLAYDVLVVAIVCADVADKHMWLVRTMTCAAHQYNQINRVAEQLVNSVNDGTGWVPWRTALLTAPLK